MDITDDYMHERLARTRSYAVALLHPGPAYEADGRDEIVWEHGRRNFALRAGGKMVLVGPITDESDWCGVCVFAADPDEAAALMDGDPAVEAGIFTYEVHPRRSFPGDALP